MKNLNDEILDRLCEVLKLHLLNNPIRTNRLLYSINVYADRQGLKKIDAAKLRAYIYFIRSNAILPIISNNNAYYISYNQDEIDIQIDRLEKRIGAMKKSISGLNKLKIK